MKQKNVFKKLVSALLLVCVMVCTLTACTTTLSGTYTNKEGQTVYTTDIVIEEQEFYKDFDGSEVIIGSKVTLLYGNNEEILEEVK